MNLTMINTHKAYLALQNAGVADKQAEVMVEIFAEMQQENSLTKADLSQAMEGVVRMQHATHNRMDNLEERFNHFEKDVKDRFNSIDIRFDKIDEKFGKIDLRFNGIDQNFVAMKKDIYWLKGIAMAIVCALIPAVTKFMFM